MGNPKEKTLIKPGKRIPVKALTATLAVALLLAFTRWGSYIGIAPLFLTDVLIALAVVDRLGKARRQRGLQFDGPDNKSPGAILTLFLILVVARGIMSFDYVFTMPWLRDMTPFLYGILAFLSASSFARSSIAEQAKSMKYLWWALLAHLAWVAFVVFSGIVTASLPKFPGAAVSVLTLRPDVDVAVIGVTAGLALRRILLGHKRSRSVLLLAACLATATQFGSRAGLISVAISLAAALIVSYSSLPRGASKRTFVVLLVPVALFIGLAGLAQTTAGERLIASAFSVSTSEAAERNAQGTQQAREMSWQGIIDWTMDDPARAIVGSGFGNDFLTESGVIQFLQGTDYVGVRSPHNWLVGVFARLGLVGVALAASVLFLLVRAVARSRHRIGGNELLTAASLVVLGFIPIALLGVVLESPFGAVPFWWAAGIVLCLGQATLARSARLAKGNRPRRLRYRSAASSRTSGNSRRQSQLQ